MYNKHKGDKMRKFETILIKNPKTGKNMSLVLKDNIVDKVVCSCDGKYTKASDCNAFVFDEEKRTLKCPECGKELEIIETPAERKERKEVEAEERNREALKNLKLVEAGSDWECGFKFYELSANIDYNNWLKVKEHFKYYAKGWSNSQELEWNYGEPSGWLTTNPEAVEEILVEAGLIKPENTMKSISERIALEKEQKEKEMTKRKELSDRMKEIHSKINDEFISCNNARGLSDSEADEHYFNPDFGKGNVVTYTVTDTEIIQCRNMGDFKTGVAIPYTENLENLIKEFYELNNKFWEE